MSKRTLSVGLIGCGWIAEVAHMPSLAASPHARVVRLVDRMPERRDVARRFFPDAHAGDDPAALLADASIDAVVIATPPGATPPLAMQALTAGKHVFLEKPMATTLAEAGSLLAAARRAGTIHLVGYNFRRHEAVLAAVQALRAGQLGELLTLHGHFTWQSSGATGWRADPGTGGGALNDLASHHIDLAAYLAGAPVRAVSATLRGIRHAEDTADIALRTDNGVCVTIHASGAAGRNANALRLIGTRGHVAIDLTDPHAAPVLTGDPPRSRTQRLRAALAGLQPQRFVHSGREASFAATMAAFLAACQSGTPAAPTIEDGAQVLAATDAARRSAARGGAWVDLDAEPAQHVA